MQYGTGKCCDAPDHLTNVGGKKNSIKLGEGLASVHQWIKDLTFGKRITSFKVLNPNVLLELGEDERVAGKRMATYWKSDPVHMSEEGYEVMAKALAIEMLDISYTREKTQSSSSNNEQIRSQAGSRKTRPLLTANMAAEAIMAAEDFMATAEVTRESIREDEGASKAEGNMEEGSTSPTSCPILYR
jgi:hypothetical protein